MIDLVLLGVIGLSALLGLFRGFIGIVVGTLSWLLAVWLSFLFGGAAADWLAQGQHPGLSHYLGGYGGVFVVVFAAVALVGWLIRAAVNAVRLGGLDRIAGFGLGALRGVVLACVLVLLMGYSSLPQEAAWRQSQVVPWLAPGAQWMRAQLPDWSVPVTDLGKLALPGDNGDLSATGQPVALPAAEGRAGQGGETATAEPAAALPRNIEPAPARDGESGPRRVDPHGQARPPSQ
ncbi:MAG TPA: CvpA family protein [Stenotrophomonas sp.]|nr:CvpA family protein [Stenotrophomonas sp.]